MLQSGTQCSSAYSSQKRRELTTRDSSDSSNALVERLPLGDKLADGGSRRQGALISRRQAVAAGRGRPAARQQRRRRLLPTLLLLLCLLVPQRRGCRCKERLMTCMCVSTPCGRNSRAIVVCGL